MEQSGEKKTGLRPGTVEDEAILARYWDRAADALTLTREKYGALCRSIASRLLPDVRDAEECVSDVYLRAWSSIPPERPDCFRAWLARVTRNAALDRIKYNGASCRSSALAEAFEELEPWIAAAGSDPQSHLEDGELRRVINSFLRAQTPDARRYFLRRYWYGESVREIAAACGVREGQVKTSLFRTRARLRAELDREGIRL